jgi:hypothetical protein
MLAISRFIVFSMLREDELFFFLVEFVENNNFYFNRIYNVKNSLEKP